MTAPLHVTRGPVPKVGMRYKTRGTMTAMATAEAEGGG